MNIINIKHNINKTKDKKYINNYQKVELLKKSSCYAKCKK